MEKITIKNFGPIKHADIEVRDICVLIGHTSSGKSTVAKLLAIFNSTKFYSISPGDETSALVPLLEAYGINFKFQEDTFISYQKEEYHWRISQTSIQTNFEYGYMIQYLYLNETDSRILKERVSYFISMILDTLSTDTYQFEKQSLDLVKDLGDSLGNNLSFARHLAEEYIRKDIPTIYIPAERILMSVLSQSIFSFYDKDINLPASLKKFGNLYSHAKQHRQSYSIDFLELQISFSLEKGDTISLKEGENIPFSQASSGLQSIIPMLSVFDLKICENRCFIIEEPELNLYTTLQKELMEYLVKRVKETSAKLIITTHSPYILSTLQNLLQAGNIAKESEEKAKQIEQIIPRSKWVDYENLTCMFMGADGTCKNILDEEYHTIGINEMDNVSEELSEIYDSLLEIKYHE